MDDLDPRPWATLHDGRSYTLDGDPLRYDGMEVWARLRDSDGLVHTALLVDDSDGTLTYLLAQVDQPCDLAIASGALRTAILTAPRVARLVFTHTDGTWRAAETVVAAGDLTDDELPEP